MSKLQVVNELHKPARRKFKRRKVRIVGIDEFWQSDLCEMIQFEKYNKHNKYILTVIDTFSKFAWCLPLKSKKGEEVTNAMEKIFKLGRKPSLLQTDNGTEFFNSHFKKLLDKYGVKHFATYSSLKASIVERFNRTLKNLIWKQFSIRSSYKWIDILDELVEKYNNTYHSTIKMKPVEVNSKTIEEQLRHSVYNYNQYQDKKQPKFKKNDHVRISKFKTTFEKGYTFNWTPEIFQISQVHRTNPITYSLRDYQNKPIEGKFYEFELQKTNNPSVYLISKIIKRKGDKLLVKWLGFKDNTWIHKNDIV